jgi:hypothetical protein
MKKKLLLVAVVSAISLVSCKKESTSPSNSSTTTTNNTTSNTLSYGQYTGSGTTVTDTKYYDEQGNLIPGMSSTTSTGAMPVAILGKDGLGNTIITGGEFINTPIKLTGTNFTVAEYEYSKQEIGGVTVTQTISGSGTIIGKDITIKSVMTSTGTSGGKTTSVSVKSTTASFHFYV